MSPLLAAYHKNATHVLRRALPVFIERPDSLATALRLCEQCRIRGSASLLMRGEDKRLHVELHRSARLFAFALERVGSYEQVLSQAAPYFDALACGDHEAARMIAVHSAFRWVSGSEYEDDYCYVAALMALAHPGDLDQKPGPLLERYDSVLQGNEDPRHSLLLALHAEDADGFAEAFEALVEMHEARYAYLMEREAVLPEEAETARYVFIEGLALLRCAQRRGIAPNDRYRAVPELPAPPQVMAAAETGWQRLG